VPPGVRLLVLDAESTDGTPEVARAAGAVVVVRPWAGFVGARLYALSLVQTPWTLMLDADERLDAPLVAAIAAAEPSDLVDGYSIARVTYFCGRPIVGGGWGGERLLRLFRTGSAQLVAQPAAGGSAQVHERWRVAGEVGELAGELHHDSYPTVASYRAKFARYTSLEAAGLHVTPSDVAAAAVRALVRFPWLLIGRGGWRDGWRGAYISAASALYPAVVAFKAWQAR
jgi:glycosyltransferase involved in cell wall biosynthesis